MPSAAKPSKRAKPGRAGDLARKVDALARRLARMEKQLAALAEAREDAADVTAIAAARAEGPGRPYEDVRRELGLELRGRELRGRLT